MTCVVEEMSWLKINFQLATSPGHQQQQQQNPPEKNLYRVYVHRDMMMNSHSQQYATDST